MLSAFWLTVLVCFVEYYVRSVLLGVRTDKFFYFWHQDVMVDVFSCIIFAIAEW